MPTFFYHSDRSELDQYVVEVLTLQAQRIAEEKGTVVIGLPGGSSLVGVFKKWLDAQFFPWEAAQFFFVDERLVPHDDDQSNYKQAAALLFEPLLKNNRIQQEQIHPFNTSESIEQALTAYEQQLNNYGGAFDIALLGVGPDAHTAALFPEHQALQKTEPFTHINDSPKPPARRMTSTPALLRKSAVGIALIIGDGKHQAQMQYLKPDVSFEQCPIKLINDIERSYIVTQFEL